MANPGTKVTATHTIKPGERFALPSGATVKSVALDGNITLSSGCAAVQERIDNAEEYLCYEFVYSYDETGDTNVGDEVELRNLIIGNTLYPINLDGDNSLPGYGTIEAFEENLEKKLPKGVCNLVSVTLNAGVTNTEKIIIKVKMIPSIAAQASIYIVMLGFDESLGSGLYIKPELVECEALS